MAELKAAQQGAQLAVLSGLEGLITRVAAIDFSSQTSEQATREMVVNPIIAELGWDTFNPNEVVREHSVLGGRVDYCLRTRDREFALIEVKRVGSDLSEHQEQLLRYAFQAGMPLAALTDGLRWWLYLPMADTTWEQRRFSRIDFRDQEVSEAAEALYRFLNRKGLVSGKSQQAAQREFEGQERDRRVRAALQEAWQQVLDDPQGLLRDLLAETVQEISGEVPDDQTIGNFLERVSGNDGAGNEGGAGLQRSAGRPAGVRQPGSPPPKNTGPKKKQSSSKRKGPFRFSMVGIEIGTILTSIWDDGTVCTVLSDNKVRFKNEEMSLSGAALQVVHDRGKTWKAVSGPESWRYNGEILAAMRERLSKKN